MRTEVITLAIAPEAYLKVCYELIICQGTEEALQHLVAARACVAMTTATSVHMQTT